MIPTHSIYHHLGDVRSRTVVKAHILTGQDCMSKIGTKHCALVCNPERYLSNFGESSALSEQDVALAEEFLVKCWVGARSSTSCKSFDKLRVERYTSGNYFRIQNYNMIS